MPVIPESPFDGGRNWLDVRSSVAHRLRNKFPFNIEDVLEDVLSEVMVDLLGYWSRLASSQHSTSQLSFAFAVRRGTWMGVHKVTRVFAHNERVLPFDPQEHRARLDSLGGVLFTFDNATAEDEARYGVGGVGKYIDFVDPSPTPEEAAMDDDELSRARQMLSEMSHDELQEYFAELTGETVRAEADRTGNSVGTTHARRKARRLELRDRAFKYGLDA